MTDQDRLEAAFAAVERVGFLPPDQRRYAGQDRPLPIGHGATNSQPSTVRDMLLLLQVPVGARVVEVGAGSGWVTALLAHLTGPGGQVLGLEVDAELAAWGAGNLAAAGMPWAQLQAAQPGVLGHPGLRADRILVSAMAAELPTALLDQLAPNAVLVAPVDGRMLRLTRRPGHPDQVERFGHYRFVPLR